MAKTETLDEYVRRGGKIRVVKTTTRSVKDQSAIEQGILLSGYLGLGPKKRPGPKHP